MHCAQNDGVKRAHAKEWARPVMCILCSVTDSRSAHEENGRNLLCPPRKKTGLRSCSSSLRNCLWPLHDNVNRRRSQGRSRMIKSLSHWQGFSAASGDQQIASKNHFENFIHHLSMAQRSHYGERLWVQPTLFFLLLWALGSETLFTIASGKAERNLLFSVLPFQHDKQHLH